MAKCGFISLVPVELMGWGGKSISLGHELKQTSLIASYMCVHFPQKLKPRVVQTVNVGCKASQNVDLIAAELVGWVEKGIHKVPNCSKLLLSHTIRLR